MISFSEKSPLNLKWNAIRVDAPIAEDETGFEDIPEEEIQENNSQKTNTLPAKSFSDRLSDFFDWCSDEIFAKFECALENHFGPVSEMSFYKDTTFVIWKIDAYARRIFPLVFLILQVLYWTSYLYVL